MIKTIQKLVKIGTSRGVTLPAKALNRQNFSLGDELVITASLVRKANAEDQKVIDAAKAILKSHKKDFDNLAKR